MADVGPNLTNRLHHGCPSRFCRSWKIETKPRRQSGAHPNPRRGTRLRMSRSRLACSTSNTSSSVTRKTPTPTTRPACACSTPRCESPGGVDRLPDIGQGTSSGAPFRSERTRPTPGPLHLAYALVVSGPTALGPGHDARGIYHQPSLRGYRSAGSRPVQVQSRRGRFSRARPRL